MTQKEAAAIGIIGMLAAMGAAIFVCSLIWYVLQVIARWKIFTKAGEKGWKAIIPVYNEFVMYKISWKTMFFWIMFALVVAGSIVSSLAGTGQNANGFLLFLAFVLLIAACVIGMINGNGRRILIIRCHERIHYRVILEFRVIAVLAAMVRLPDKVLLGVLKLLA